MGVVWGDQNLGDVEGECFEELDFGEWVAYSEFARSIIEPVLVIAEFAGPTSTLHH